MARTSHRRFSGAVKPAWEAKYFEYLDRILELLQTLCDVNAGNLAQYKSLFFKIFADAYRRGFCTTKTRLDKTLGRDVPCHRQHPIITGSAIWDYALEKGWIHAEVSETELSYRNILMLRVWWDEWTYAWKNCPVQPTRLRSIPNVRESLVKDMTSHRHD